MPNNRDINHRMKVARINFLLGAQNFVDCLNRHPPRIHMLNITVSVPVAAIRIEDKLVTLVGFCKIIGTKPNTNDGTMMIPIISRCKTKAANIVKP